MVYRHERGTGIGRRRREGYCPLGRLEGPRRRGYSGGLDWWNVHREFLFGIVCRHRFDASNSTCGHDLLSKVRKAETTLLGFISIRYLFSLYLVSVQYLFSLCPVSFLRIFLYSDIQDSIYSVSIQILMMYSVSIQIYIISMTMAIHFQISNVFKYCHSDTSEYLQRYSEYMIYSFRYSNTVIQNLLHSEIDIQNIPKPHTS